MFALLRSFMRGRTDLGEDEASVEYVPNSLIERLNFEEIFARNGAIEIDLGCGDGAFLIAMARANPAHNFLGIERLLGRVRKVCRKVAREDLKNARVVQLDVAYAIQHLFPPESVTAFHLLFPDPWPKRRHHRRRTFTAEFLSSVHGALTSSGLFHIATDHRDYFHQIKTVITATNTFVISPEPDDFPRTTFEQRFLARGVSVHRLLLRKLSPSK